MANKRRKQKRGNSNLTFVCFILVWLTIIGIVFMAAHLRDRARDKETDDSDLGAFSDTSEAPNSDTENDPNTDTETVITEPDPVTYSEATIISAGDIMFHMAQINYANAVGTDGNYDFTNTFKYIKDIVSSADYAVVNFETTLAGADVGYSGYPSFNAPDSSLDAVKGAGFDLMLFANNHCYDKNLSGLLRTQETFESCGLDYIGAKKEIGDDAYTIVEINGIKVGMFNYADDLSAGNTEKRTINGKSIKNDDLYYMNLYNLSLLDDLYDEVEDIMGKMESEGVDVVIAYMHWGYEYNIKHNSYQEKVAQQLANLGVDIIIGGHPHVIQDVETLTSENDADHKTLCFYSLGNFVSNQNRRSMGDTKNSTYTEGGLMVEITLRKYSTGESMISEVKEIPTFVHRYKASNGYYVHEIVPLEYAVSDPESYGLNGSSFGLTEAKEVYDLELDVLGDVVEAYNSSIVLPAIGEPVGEPAGE